ncbi:hypothetical protein QR680_010551 [Steinernema hermaphroditum]|uniref:Uncharacterized protein n=1 Tax=Steinernema hermaphroditum TaxID=289476 RepID=A0AA39IQZ0_9BILA|nr:hypothetical protein QR680_010551 [Steinernema hermaphroditum]
MPKQPSTSRLFSSPKRQMAKEQKKKAKEGIHRNGMNGKSYYPNEPLRHEDLRGPKKQSSPPSNGPPEGLFLESPSTQYSPTPYPSPTGPYPEQSPHVTQPGSTYPPSQQLSQLPRPSR